MIEDYLKMAVENIKHRKLRSWLTMIGIFIGIAAVVALISIGQGLQAAITAEFNEMGTNLLIIRPRGAGFAVAGGDNPAKLTLADRDEISKVDGVVETSTMVFRSARIEFKDEVNYQLVTGIPVDEREKRNLIQKMADVNIDEGRNLDSGDRFEVLMGHLYTKRDEVFSRKVRVGNKIDVGNTTFDIIGKLEEVGTDSDDKRLVMPIETAEDLLKIEEIEGEEVRDLIVAEINPSLKLEEMSDTVKRKLRKSRGLEEGEEDFEIQTPQQLLDSFNSILAIVQAVLIGIAGISLIVGGIGIMNTMYAAVVQRTKEIGIMKAIGARNRDILSLFLIESGMLGLLGGAIGILLGYGISSVVTRIISQYLSGQAITTFFPAWLVIGGLMFSFVIGAISGVYPAYQASKMDPVEALRYE